MNSVPLKLLRPETLRYKLYEPILVVGERRFRKVNIKLHVSGGGHTSQIYAIRQAIAKGLVAYYAKHYDAASALELKRQFIAYDRSLLIADPRRMEPKKFGGRGARARRQKSCVDSVSSYSLEDVMLMMLLLLVQVPLNVSWSMYLCIVDCIFVSSPFVVSKGTFLRVQAPSAFHACVLLCTWMSLIPRIAR